MRWIALAALLAGCAAERPCQPYVYDPAEIGATVQRIIDRQPQPDVLPWCPVPVGAVELPLGSAARPIYVAPAC